MSSKRLALIGAGRVGTTLGCLLAEHGYDLRAIVCRRVGAARRAAKVIGRGVPMLLAAMAEVEIDVVMICTPDDRIADVAGKLASIREWHGVVVLHTSGALDSSVLGPLANSGADVGSMHPLQSFSIPKAALALVEGSMFAIEGSRRAVAVAATMARAVGARPARLSPGAKPLYHAAAVLAAGHVTALLDLSAEAMTRAGLPRDGALAALLSLTRGTLENVALHGTELALTGPFARGDEGTIERNRQALAAFDERALEIYDLLGARSRSIRARRKPSD